ncbi:ribosomal protein L7/L12 [Actinomadura alba]|uniref:Ribosomal protein L7/L12 n=1 Tax=Actinomadura alba TaxID=406431 RepID=A0ABR7LN96_9ACTN|nr:ribosomal protein L7/L12 [Actinomadura alba]MBC6465957.1 ribosomal protein L7/L12 [Actinomadura alba]
MSDVVGISGFWVLLLLPFLFLCLILLGLLAMAGQSRRRDVVRMPPQVALPSDVEMSVRDLIARRRKIEAIKLVRESTRLGLKDAKDLVDAMEAGHPVGGLTGGPVPTGLFGPAGMVPAPTRERAEELVAKGRLIEAIKLVRQETGFGLREAKDYCEALRDGRLPPAGPLSERARALAEAGDRAGAVALVRGETGMAEREAEKFLDALD